MVLADPVFSKFSTFCSCSARIMSSIRFVIVLLLAVTCVNGRAAWDEEIADSNYINSDVIEDTEDTGEEDPIDVVPAYDPVFDEETGNEITEAPGVTEELFDPELFEGDIENVNASDVAARNSIVNPRLKWPQGRVPYVISNSFSRSQVSTIRSAMEQYKQRTCIRFVPRNNERDYVFIQPGSGCSSSVGRQGGGQRVNLGRGCVYTGIVVHELMHAIGFWHEQSRPDRDKYVTINWKNIQRGMAHNFQRFSHGEVDMLNLPYDIGSVMHYGAYYFAVNSRTPTITNKNGGTKMGQRNGFSNLDVQKINKLYKCR